jgi:Uma2 family endonuclease
LPSGTANRLRYAALAAWKGGVTTVLDRRLVLTYEDLLQMPDDGHRRELLGGNLYVTPAPSPLHQRVADRVTAMLLAYEAAHGGVAASAPLDVVLSAIDTVQPDVVYVAPDRTTIVGPRAIQGTPTLVIEVLSPSTADVDRAEKLVLYARHGVPEYWIVDPIDRVVTVHPSPRGNAYMAVQAYAAGDRLRSATLAALEVAVDSLFPSLNRE